MKTVSILSRLAGMAGAAILVLGGCDASFNPSFKQLTAHGDNRVRYGTEEEGTGAFKWDITFPSAIGVDPSKSYFQLAPEGGEDILALGDNWLQGTSSDIRVQGSCGPLKAGAYFLRLLLAKEGAYVLVAMPVAIHRDQETLFERKYSEDDFQPFMQLTVKIKVKSAVPVDLQKAKLEFFGGQQTGGQQIPDGQQITGGQLDVQLVKTNFEPDVRHIDMKKLDRDYQTEGWTALPQPDVNQQSEFFAKLTVTDVKGRDFIRIRKFTTSGQTINLDWGTFADTEASAKPLNLLNEIFLEEDVTHGKFEFSSRGSDGKLHGVEEGYKGAESGCEVRVRDRPEVSQNQNIQYGLQWIQILSKPEIDSSGKLTQEVSEGGYFAFKMPNNLIEPFLETNSVKDPDKHSSNFISSIKGKTAVIVSGNFMVLPGVATLQDPNEAPSNSFIHFQAYAYLEDAFDKANASTGTETRIITVMQDISATRDASSYFIRSSANKISINTNKHIALVPKQNSGSISIKLEDDNLENLFYVDPNGSLTINASSGTSFTIDGGGKQKVLIAAYGSLDIQGGVFKNSQSTDAAIKVAGAFKMSDGSIEGNAHALDIQNSASNPELSGNVYIPYSGTQALPTNDIIISSATTIKLNGTLAKLTATQPACLTPPATAPIDDWKDGRPVLTGTMDNNYAKFKFKSQQDTNKNNAEVPYTITSRGELYSPQAYIDDDSSSGKRTYYLRLDKAVKAALDSTATNATVCLLKDINLGETGNEALSVSASPYITVSNAKCITLQPAFNQFAGMASSNSKAAIKRANANAAQTIFTVNNGMLILSDVILDGNKVTGSPAMVAVSGNNSTFTLKNNSEIKNHSGTVAALSASTGSIVKLETETTLSGNVSTGNGGAIYNSGSTVTIGGTAKLENNAADLGGAIYNTGGGSVQIDSATLSSNKANYGGAIYNSSSNSSVEIKNSTTLSSNEATVNGGAIYNVASLKMSGTAKIENNNGTTNTTGKGIYQNGTFTMADYAYVTPNNDIFLVNGKTISFGSQFGTTQSAKMIITPEGTVTAARLVLSGQNISSNKQYFTVNPPSGQTTTGNNSWSITDDGYLFLGFGVSCSIPENPGTMMLNFTTSGQSYKPGENVTVSFNSTQNIAGYEVRMDGTLIPQPSLSGTQLSFTIPNSLGKRTITVFLTIGSHTYSGNFQIFVIQ